MRSCIRVVTDPYYWRKGIMRLLEILTNSTHAETEMDHVISDCTWLPYGSSASISSPASGMTLLYVAPKFDYGNPARGYSYEENHFLPSLAALGFRILRLDSLSLVSKTGKERASEILVEIAYRFKPAVAFFVLFKDDFEQDAIAEIKRTGCTTVNWFCDDQWRLETFSIRWAPVFTWAVTTDPSAPAKYEERGIRNVLLSQWGVNHHLYRPLPRDGFKYEVSFIGQPHGNRREIISRLKSLGTDVHVWGYGWPAGKLNTGQAVRVINDSRVNLNLSNAVTLRTQQIKGRDFEVPACRALMLTGEVPGLRQYFEPGKEILTYSDFDELVSMIKWVGGHPSAADQIRERGYERVLAEHTYEARFRGLFSHMGVL